MKFYRKQLNFRYFLYTHQLLSVHSSPCLLLKLKNIWNMYVNIRHRNTYTVQFNPSYLISSLYIFNKIIKDEKRISLMCLVNLHQSICVVSDSLVI